MKRVKGYVVGYDKRGGEIVWDVKVKDDESIHHGQKFQVASLHPGVMLSKPGIDVTFRVQDFGSGQEKVLKAVDVSVGLKDPQAEQIKEKIPNPMMFAITGSPENDFLVWLREETTEAEAIENSAKDSDDEVVGVFRITPELVLKHGGAISDDEAAAGLAAVRQLVGMDPIRDVLCAIAAEAFLLGQRQATKQQNSN